LKPTKTVHFLVVYFATLP